MTSYICQDDVILTSCGRWVLILYQSRADRSELPFAHVSPRILENQQHKIETLIRLRTRRSDIAPPSYKKRVPVSLIHSRKTLKLQESKKQRFATLTNDEYVTLSTPLQERESNNTRRAADMAVRTFDHTSMTKLLI